MPISSKLLQAVMDRLEYYSDIPIPYGLTYEAELSGRARAIIELIERIREEELEEL
jgi:hypothetical protein